jgi:hypothetical protein
MAIMTSCRRLLTRFAVCIAVGALAGCAAPLATNSAVDVLDAETGITVTKLARPVEFTVTEGRGPTRDPFAYIGLFQTNRMGTRAEFLWIALPIEGTMVGAPVLSIDDTPIVLPEATNDPSLANLKTGPYAAPAPWSRQFYYSIDSSLAVRLASAGRLSIRSEDTGGNWTFVASPAAQSALGSYIDLR